MSEAAVVGLNSEQWGQKVAAVVVLHSEHAHSGRGGKTWGVMDMRRALKDKLANYKIPQELKVVDVIPKNAMGKSQSCLPSNILISHANSDQSTRRVWSKKCSVTPLELDRVGLRHRDYLALSRPYWLQTRDDDI